MVHESQHMVEEAVDGLLVATLAIDIDRAQMTFARRRCLLGALFPRRSMDHVLNCVATLKTLQDTIVGISEHAQPEHRIIEFIRLVEDAEPAARADFESEAVATRLERVTAFLCAELSEWGDDARDAEFAAQGSYPGLTPPMQRIAPTLFS